MVIATRDPNPEYATAIEVDWLFGKKNNVIFVLGAPDGDKIEWARVVSISDVEMLKIRARDEIPGKNLSDVIGPSSYMQDLVSTEFTRTPMETFEYMRAMATPPTWLLAFLYTLSVLLSVGGAFATHKEDINENFPRLRKFYSRDLPVPGHLGIQPLQHRNWPGSSPQGQWKANQVKYDNMWKTVQETAQVAERERGSFKDIFLGAMSGRYGDGGSQAVMQWITEHNPTPTPDLYQKVMNIIEALRNTFANSQKMLADRQVVYQTTIKSPMGAMLWNGVFGFPSEVMGKYAPPEDTDGDGRLTGLDYPIVTSAKTDKVLQEAQENEPMSVFGDKKE